MYLNSQRDKLVHKRDELQKRVDAIKSDFAGGRSADFAEQATETENDDVLRSLKREAEREIRQINQALERIKQGEYGLCVKCGEEIDPQRLAVFPHASFCIRCA